MNISLTNAISVALFSALISFVVQFFFKWNDRRYQAKTFELSITAEVEAILNIMEKRNYRKGLEEGIFLFGLGEKLSKNEFYTLEVQIQENYCPIYFNNLDKISLIRPKKVKDVVRFYSLLMSLAQDVKPDGLLNTGPSREAYDECLSIFDEAIMIGKRIIN
ncbi:MULTISPECIES: hypothetical protein [unclassified Acinetobacter]|uniref:hypothetical protein n=1 Tax=unclassified Acinetobacter TaxID=196816 RepID=UPI0018EBC1F8|nr:MULTISPECIES: hypothetical protein [unclassified Acinetobacter]MBJ6351121.1 hypothetical protein [Acinetobacter sp. c1]MBM0956747.1 hypothetical protein [Acinetobacter sp. C13]